MSAHASALSNRAASVPLHLDAALELLRQAGTSMPAADPDSPADLQALIDALVQLSSRDPLTGLANRRSFDLALGRELDRIARLGESALLLAVDIDHFKRVNDEHGHASGDAVLRSVGAALAKSVRPMDLVARVGGEEFAILLPNCPVAFGPQVAERVRLQVARSPTTAIDGRRIDVTVSLGGAFAAPWVRSNAVVWLERADRQLYRAKHEGRNRACLETVVQPQVSELERQMLLGVEPAEESE